MSKIDLVKNGLQQIINNIDTGNSNASDADCDMILSVVNKITNVDNKFSKYQACKYLNVSRATFDNYIRAGKLPRGKKEQGFTELFWYLDDLKKFKETYDNRTMHK